MGNAVHLNNHSGWVRGFVAEQRTYPNNAYDTVKIRHNAI